MIFDFLGAGRNFVVTKDKLEGVLQGNMLKYQRRFFQDRPQSKYFDLLSSLTNEEMWHYEIMGALYTRQRQFLTPCLLSKKDGLGHDVSALCLLVTPCLKAHILFHSVENGYFIHQFDPKKDSISLDDYTVENEGTISLDVVRELLKDFFETQGPYGSKAECEAAGEIFQSWRFDPNRRPRSERKSRWPALDKEVVDKVSENNPPGTATTVAENKDSKGFKLPNDVIAYFDAIIYNSNRLSRNVLCFDRFTQNNKDHLITISCFEYVILRRNKYSSNRFVFVGVFVSSALRKDYKDKSFYVVYDIETKACLGCVLSSLQGTGIFLEGKAKREMEEKVRCLGKTVKGKNDLSGLSRTATPIKVIVTPKQGLYESIVNVCY